MNLQQPWHARRSHSLVHCALFSAFIGCPLRGLVVSWLGCKMWTNRSVLHCPRWSPSAGHDAGYRCGLPASLPGGRERVWSGLPGGLSGSRLVFGCSSPQIKQTNKPHPFLLQHCLVTSSLPESPFSPGRHGALQGAPSRCLGLPPVLVTARFSRRHCARTRRVLVPAGT